MRRVALLPLIAFVCSPAFAGEAEGQHCSQLPTAAERIVCYDRQFPPDHAPAASTEVPARPASIADIPVRSIDPTPGPESVPVASASASAASTESPEQDKSWLRGMLDRPVKHRESSTIKEMHRRDSQSMAFLLDNDQIWLQDSPRMLPFHVGDSVTIENGSFGGYFLTSDGGTKTRVRRIK